MTRNVSQRNFKKLTSDMKAIEKYISENKVVTKTAECIYDEVATLHHGNGENNGVLYYSDYFGFNGDRSKNTDHETMSISLGENDWTFCKTARKPYDLAVCLILISLKYHIRSTRVTSDGEPYEWKQALDLWNEIFPNRNIVARFKPYESGDKKLDGSLALYSKEEVENIEKLFVKSLEVE